MAQGVGGGVGAAPSFTRAVLRLAPPESFEAAARDALSAVDRTVKAVFGGAASVLPFGSLVQGAHLRGSDLDLCIRLPGDASLDVDGAASGAKQDNSSQVAALKRLTGRLPATFRVLETRFWKNIKVPIAILAYGGACGERIEADVSVGALSGGVEKGYADRLVRRVLARCPRALHTVRVVKLWAKAEQLNKAYDGFLNALGWTLLVLFFFMQRGECMPSILHEEEESEHGLDTGPLPPPLPGCEESELIDEEHCDVPTCSDVADFFDWLPDYSAAWPEDGAVEGETWAISLVDGELVEVQVPTAGKKWADQCSFFIEDPAARLAKCESENVARSLKKEPWRATLEKCRAAANTLRACDATKGAAWLSNLLQRSLAPAPAPGGAAFGNGNALGFHNQLRQAARPAAGVAPAFGIFKRAWEPMTAVAAQAMPPAKRQKSDMVCRWFQKGQCWDGDACKLSHE